MNSLEVPRLSLRDRLSGLIGQPESAPVIVLRGAGLLMSIVSPVFLRGANIEVILIALSMEGTITIGMAILLISGGFDLSVGSTLAFTGVVTGLGLNAGLPGVLAVLLGLMAAQMVGLANGLLVTRLGINPFITTLGTAMVVRGLLLVIAHGRAVLTLPSSFTVTGQGRLFGVHFPIFLMPGL